MTDYKIRPNTQTVARVHTQKTKKTEYSIKTIK